MNDLCTAVASSLLYGPLPRHLPRHIPGSSIERNLAKQGVTDTQAIASAIGALCSGAWPIVERTEWGACRLTEAGRAQVQWLTEIEVA